MEICWYLSHIPALVAIVDLVADPVFLELLLLNTFKTRLKSARRQIAGDAML